MGISDETKQQLNGLLAKLKQAHHVYLKSDEGQKARLMDACQSLIGKLVTISGKEGVEAGPGTKSFYEALLVFGEEFLIAEYGDPEEKIFGAFKQPMSDSEIKEAEEMKAIGCTIWRKEGGRLIPEAFKTPPTMQELKARQEWQAKHKTV